LPKMIRCNGTCGRMIAMNSRTSCESPICRPCRALIRAAVGVPRGDYRDRYELTCEHCGGGFRAQHIWRRFCSRACANTALHPAYRPAGTARVDRVRRDAVAPGLNPKARARLLRVWKRRGCGCVYCGGPAQSVDHVVPLVRGGTNYEGNLVPCCRRCNSSKSGLLLIEWRAGYSARRILGRTSFDAMAQ
jgi:5-methylcytosine-specific restriction endonuclease McrA